MLVRWYRAYREAKGTQRASEAEMEAMHEETVRQARAALARETPADAARRVEAWRENFRRYCKARADGKAPPPPRPSKRP